MGGVWLEPDWADWLESDILGSELCAAQETAVSSAMNNAKISRLIDAE